MRIRLALALAAVVLATVLAAGVSVAPLRAEPGSWADAPEKLPRLPRGDRIKNLEFLFEALKAAPDPDSAKLVEGRIWALWLASGSDTTDLLMSRVKSAMDAAWRRTPPEASPLLAQMREQVARAEQQLASAKAAGDTRRIRDAEQALESKRKFLAMAEHTS